MSEPCFFCGEKVNPHDVGTWKQVSSWVTGPKSDGAKVREYTGRYAHGHCIAKAALGQPPDQGELL